MDCGKDCENGCKDCPQTFYGYTISVPTDMSYSEFVCKMIHLNKSCVLPLSFEQFQITGLIHNLPTNISEDHPDCGEDSKIVIGFKPSRYLPALMQSARNLESLIEKTRELRDLDISVQADFHTGFEWFNRVHHNVCDCKYEEQLEAERLEAERRKQEYIDEWYTSYELFRDSAPEKGVHF